MTSITNISPNPAAERVVNSSKPGRCQSSDPVAVSETGAEISKESVKRPAADPLSHEIKASLEALNEMLSGSGRKLNISVDPASGAAIFEIVDAESGDTVLKVPSASNSQIDTALLIRSGVLLDTRQ